MPLRERKKIRLTNYDYNTPGAYFITACVHNRRCLFGEIHDGQMHLNAYGRIVHDQWEWLHRQYDYLMMDAFVVMPNHFHAILVIVGHGNDVMVGNGNDVMVGNGNVYVGNGRDRSLPVH